MKLLGFILLIAGNASADKWRMDTPDQWIYKPSAASNAPVLALKLVVVPFDDERELCDAVDARRKSNPIERLIAAGNGTEAEDRSQIQPEIYSRWLTEELQASGRYRSVRRVTWKELAQAPETADLVVLGRMLRSPGAPPLVPTPRCMKKHWAPGTQQSFEFQLLSVRGSPAPLWSKLGAAPRRLQVREWPKIAVVAPEEMRSLFAGFADEIYTAAQGAATP